MRSFLWPPTSSEIIVLVAQPILTDGGPPAWAVGKRAELGWPSSRGKLWPAVCKKGPRLCSFTVPQRMIFKVSKFLNIEVALWTILRVLLYITQWFLIIGRVIDGWCQGKHFKQTLERYFKQMRQRNWLSFISLWGQNQHDDMSHPSSSIFSTTFCQHCDLWDSLYQKRLQNQMEKDGFYTG